MLGLGKRNLLDSLTPDKAYNEFERELIGESASTPTKSLELLKSRLDRVAEPELKLSAAYVAAARYKFKLIPVGAIAFLVFTILLGLPEYFSSLPISTLAKTGLAWFVVLALFATLIKALRSAMGLYLLESIINLRLAELGGSADKTSGPGKSRTK